MEKWKAYSSEHPLPPEFFMESLTDSSSGLCIWFVGRECKTFFNVRFINRVLSYRNTDEGSLLQTIGYFALHYGDKYFGKNAIFEVYDSPYLEWFLKESGGLYTKNDIKHYVFLTPSDVVEVLSNDPPSIELEEAKKL